MSYPDEREPDYPRDPDLARDDIEHIIGIKDDLAAWFKSVERLIEGGTLPKARKEFMESREAMNEIADELLMPDWLDHCMDANYDGGNYPPDRFKSVGKNLGTKGENMLDVMNLDAFGKVMGEI